MIINLLKEKPVRMTKTEKIRRLNRMVLIISATGFGLMVLVLLFQYGYYRSQTNTAQRKISELETEYLSRSSEVEKYKRVKDLYGHVEGVFSLRYPYTEMIEMVYKMLPSGVVVTSVGFSEKGTMTFSAKMTGVMKYQEFLTEVNKFSADIETLFGGVVQKSLSRAAKGEYRIELVLETRKS